MECGQTHIMHINAATSRESRWINNFGACDCKFGSCYRDKFELYACGKAWHSWKQIWGKPRAAFKNSINNRGDFLFSFIYTTGERDTAEGENNYNS